jgi:hypothetical protein|tara:strand:- start:53 stop:571 length:519 start_codon:yes stop_codon:yes gene_type:complete
MDKKVLLILKRDIPLRIREFKGKVIISAIILIIALISSSSVLAVVGLLFFGYFYFIYTSGSIYSTYKVLYKVYYKMKRQFNEDNRETIRAVISERAHLLPKKSDPYYFEKSLELLEEYIVSGYFNYNSEILVIYAAAAGTWSQENNLDNYSSLRGEVKGFFDSQIRELKDLL